MLYKRNTHYIRLHKFPKQRNEPCSDNCAQLLGCASLWGRGDLWFRWSLPFPGPGSVRPALCWAGSVSSSGCSTTSTTTTSWHHCSLCQKLTLIMMKFSQCIFSRMCLFPGKTLVEVVELCIKWTLGNARIWEKSAVLSRREVWQSWQKCKGQGLRRGKGLYGKLF